MKQYFLKTSGSFALLALITTGAFAQDNNKELSSSSTIRHNDDIIVIKSKTDVSTKLTIEINGSDVKVNGKPIAEYHSDDVIVSRRKQTNMKREVDELDVAPDARFHGNANVYGYGGVKSYGRGGADNYVRVEGMNSNKAFLGVGTEKTDGEGVSITSVTEESAAEKAGLKEGDIITKINDTKISSPEELTKIIGKFNPDEKITVTYKRDKKELKTTAVLTKRQNNSFSFDTAPFETYKNFNFDNNNNFNLVWGKPRLGLKAQETEDGKGLKVLDVDDESAAEKAGIKEGDIITSFDGTEVNNIDKLRELSKTAMEKISFKVQLMRDGKQQELDVKVPRNLKSTSL